MIIYLKVMILLLNIFSIFLIIFDILNVFIIKGKTSFVIIAHSSLHSFKTFINSF